MNRQDAEKTITEYLKPVFGFTLKRCKSIHDAEDLSQEIILKAFRALLKKDDIASMDKFIWTVAHNALANYYRASARSDIGVPFEEMAEFSAVSDLDFAAEDTKESLDRLQHEIAYLSKLQRRIVIAYYYENRKQTEIASELGIPLGTVKWHLFEAKKKLKRGMDTMRNSSELKFNPVKFELCGFAGSVGEKGFPATFFRSALAQNITYSVWRKAKTVNELADELGVSPVYVESEAEYLEEYGFLLKKGNQYLCNILLEEASDKLCRMQEKMYGKAAELFANELYDGLLHQELLKNDGILGGYCGAGVTDAGERDLNFILWTLIPYITASSRVTGTDKRISFEEVCTIRPDGGKNICIASVCGPDVKLPVYTESMKQLFGPCWNGGPGGFVLWSIDSEWSARRITENYQETVQQDLLLLNHYFSGDVLAKEEYACLAERGYLKIVGETGENFKAILQILRIRDEETKEQLLSLGSRIKEKYRTEFEALKEPYERALLAATPKHLQKMRQYGLQDVFDNDGWFVLYCMKELLNQGKLKPPAQEQRKSLTTLILPGGNQC